VRLTRKLLKKQGCAPKLAVTDKLRSYAAAFRALGLTCEQRLGNLRARRRQRGQDLSNRDSASRPEPEVRIHSPPPESQLQNPFWRFAGYYHGP
jgi:transposase-like protein